MLGRKTVRECDIIPRGYGFAYHEWNSMRGVFYPWPVNHLARWLRDMWFAVRHAAQEKAMKEAYRQGWVKGREETDAHIREMWGIIRGEKHDREA